MRSKTRFLVELGNCAFTSLGEELYSIIEQQRNKEFEENLFDLLNRGLPEYTAHLIK